MRAKMHTISWRQTPWKVTKALCSDGVRRTAWITGPPDTFFSIPAFVKVKGMSVSGFVTGREKDGKQDYAFNAYEYGKNGRLLSGIVTARTEEKEQPKYAVDGEIFPVGGGEFEYRVWLLEGREVVAEWNSLTETYEGGRHLAYEECKASIQEIKDDVAEGKAEEWFTIEGRKDRAMPRTRNRGKTEQWN